MREFVSFVRSLSGTLYNELFSCLQKEPLEHPILIRTQFLAKSLLSNTFVSKFYEILKKYHYRKEEEIIKCMKDIAVWHGNENIRFWEKTPWIKELNYNSNNEYMLKTKSQEYFFIPASEH